MSKIEQINKELENMGFVIKDNLYVLERISHNNIIINGRHMVQEQKHIFQMEYVGDGCELDDDHNEIEGTEFCGFDIKDENNCSLTTIYVSCAKEFHHFLNL